MGNRGPQGFNFHNMNGLERSGAAATFQYISHVLRLAFNQSRHMGRRGVKDKQTVASAAPNRCLGQEFGGALRSSFLTQLR